METPVGQVEDISVAKLIEECLTEYGTYVLQDRSIPDYRDGLKPVQRRILWTMYEDGATWNARFTKCSAIVGNTMSRYHPHGDTSIYGALVNMTGNPRPKNKKLFFGPNHGYPTIEGYGNFGSIDGDKAAAMRYPEARLSCLSHYMFNLEPCLVKVSNYMNTRNEPLFLPSTLPFILLNGVSGIAVGTSTDIPPHNLKEVCNALKLFLSDKPPTIGKILSKIKGPDWSYGGTITDKDEIKQMYKDGKGRISWGINTERFNQGRRYNVRITGIPPRLDLDKFLTKLSAKKDIKAITKFDISDNIDVLIETSHPKIAKEIAEAKVKVTYNWNVIHRRNESNIDLIHIDLLTCLGMWSKYLINTYSEFFKKEARRVFSDMKVDALKLVAIKHIDKVVKFIRKNDIAALANFLEADSEDLQPVITMSLGSLSGASENRIQSHYNKRKDELQEIRKNLANMNDFLKDFFEEAKIYSQPRRTIIG
jgi:DNA gyrase subunit A